MCIELLFSLTVGSTCGGVRLGTGTGYQMIINTMFTLMAGPKKELDRLASVSKAFIVESMGTITVYYVSHIRSKIFVCRWT